MKRLALVLVAALGLTACTQEAEEKAEAPEPIARPAGSANAKWEIVDMLRADAEAVRHPSDGGGTARIVEQPELPVVAGGRGRWAFEFTAGPLGITKGGRLFFLPSPFWGWSQPQSVRENAPGFTTVGTSAAGVELDIEYADPSMLTIAIGGRDLRAGEKIEIVYGAGAQGARADRYADRDSRFWFAVDGDGDGVRQNIAESPSVEIVAGPAALMIATVPSVSRPGKAIRLRVAYVDRFGNHASAPNGKIRIGGQAPDGTAVAASMDADTDGPLVAQLPALSMPGTYRFRLTDEHGLDTETNPLIVSDTAPRVRWADLHGHSGLSDGTGRPDDYFRYARDVAGLDIVSLTDHDHWGIPALDETPENWRVIKDTTEAFHAPGSFVTILGYEWTSWIHGHRHVLYFRDAGEVFSSVDLDYESPTQLWDALRGKAALTFAHHSAGGPIATNWDIPPDPELEPVTEIVSVHGVSEALDAPAAIYGAIPGNFVRDVLDRGYRLGFIGSGDSHDGHPGLSHLASPLTGGLAAILSKDLTRDGVRRALQRRAAYATSGDRIYLDVRYEDHIMGENVTTPSGHEVVLRIRVRAISAIDKIEIIRSGRIIEAIADQPRDVDLERQIPALAQGEYLYVRVIQRDRGMAWSSPFYGAGSGIGG